MRNVSGESAEVRVVGSLDQLTNWGAGNNMEDHNGAWTVRLRLHRSRAAL